MTEKAVTNLQILKVCASGTLPGRHDLDLWADVWGALRYDLWPALWPALLRIVGWCCWPVTVLVVFCLVKRVQRRQAAAKQYVKP